VHPHWLLALHVHVVFVPHVAMSDPAIVHVRVQKCVVGSPIDEHRCATGVSEQSLSDAQNLPIPSSLPVSPG
jgi:hypothetical protein